MCELNNDCHSPPFCALTLLLVIQLLSFFADERMRDIGKRCNVLYVQLCLTFSGVQFVEGQNL